MPRSTRRFIIVLVPLMILISVAVGGCGSTQTTMARATETVSMAHTVAMAPMADMPSEVQSAQAEVRQAYQFAVANPDVLEHVACYCGCVASGHTSNEMCYVKRREGGKVVFDDHAIGCSICIDITQDAMRLYREGKSVAVIRAYVDTAYSRYGPTNLPAD